MSNRLINWFKYASPQNFYPMAGKLIPWFWVLAAVFGSAGLYLGFLVAPTDAQQGEGYRIIFLHVPASWMSMFIYLVMAFWAALGLAFNTRLSGMMATALAPTGALFAFLSLWTGALWGKPMWGAWWVWDARLTSELILLFLYIGFIALQSAIDDPRRADTAGAILALVGVVVLISLATFNSNGDVSRWAAISTIWIIIPILFTGLVVIVILGGLIYLMARALSALPHYTGIAQDYVSMAQNYIIRGADMVVKPIIGLEGFIENVKAFFERITTP